MSDVKKKLLVEYFSNADSETLDFTVKILVDAMEKICEECQKDRIRCSLDPMCQERKYLMLLIEAGVPEEEYPQFCYSKKGEEIYRYFYKKTLIVPVRDAVYPIHKLILYLFPGKKRKTIGDMVRSGDYQSFAEELVDSLSPIWDSVDTKIIGSKLYLVLNKYESLSIFDFSRDLAYINLIRRNFESLEEYLEIAKFLCEINGIKYKFVSTHENTIFWRLIIPRETLGGDGNENKMGLDSIKQSLKTISSYVSLKAENGKLNEVTILLYDEYEAVEKPYKKLRNIIAVIKESI
ncbi:MAG: hypothetical protein ACP6IP_03950 [Candidatus Njordarchaeia archaeon]